MKIKIDVLVVGTLEHVWNCFTQPEHIVNWNAASEDWCCPSAHSDLKAGGSFSYRMEARDGSMGFDFSGKFNEVDFQRHILILLDDNRSLEVWFEAVDGGIRVTEAFEAENMNPVELQQQGWQAILNAYKNYCQSVS
jgi:uncharacterized protein YndB with AHSA1/START domain